MWSNFFFFFYYVVKLNQLSTTQSFSEAPVSFLVMQKDCWPTLGKTEPDINPTLLSYRSWSHPIWCWVCRCRASIKFHLLSILPINMESLKLNQPCGGAVVSTSQWCPTFITVASIVSQLICWICDICDNTLAAVASSSLDMVHTLFLAVSSRLNNRIGKVNTTLVDNICLFLGLC